MIDAIVVVTYKRNYFLAKICIASIRYFYPDVDIYLIKDLNAGDFSSTELEKAMNVKILDLGIEKFGWGSAKVHVLFSEQLKGKRVLVLDDDIVFAGRFLSKFDPVDSADFVVDPEYPEVFDDPQSQGFYYKYNDVLAYDPSFVYPGYYFNTGQMILTLGLFSEADMADIFDRHRYPYYTKRDLLPHVDQSLLNYLLPSQAQKGKVSLAAVPFMKWSDSPEVKEGVSLQELKAGNAYSYLIHYAGVLRVSDIDRMTRPDILTFFQDYYYDHVPMGKLLQFGRRYLAKADFIARRLYRRLRA